MRKLLVLLRCFHNILYKTLLIKLCALKEKFSKRHIENLMQVILLQPRGASSSLALLLVGDGHKVL